MPLFSGLNTEQRGDSNCGSQSQSVASKKQLRNFLLLLCIYTRSRTITSSSSESKNLPTPLPAPFYKTSQSDVVSVAPPTEGEYTASKPSPSASHCKLCHMDADGPERCHPSIPSCCQELGVVGAHYRADYQLGRRASCSCVELAARLIAAEAAPPSELANTGSRREAFV